MTDDLEARCLEAFPEWLRSLADDARAVATVLANPDQPESARRHCAVALNYLFKSLDLIPDGIEDLGFIDDAFVFRVAAAGAAESHAQARERDSTGVLVRLTEQVALVKEFLAEDYGRLAVYIRGLDAVSVRGRTVEDLLTDEEGRHALLQEVRAWADSYEPPSFMRDPRNLVKLRSFLGAKLPAY